MDGTEEPLWAGGGRSRLDDCLLLTFYFLPQITASSLLTSISLCQNRPPTAEGRGSVRGGRKGGGLMLLQPPSRKTRKTRKTRRRMKMSPIVMKRKDEQLSSGD